MFKEQPTVGIATQKFENYVSIARNLYRKLWIFRYYPTIEICVGVTANVSKITAINDLTSK